ncbi:tripartite tricarboxylate transporter TctB family protein [Planomicrobium sp. CPCC 101079]|uniref:tripartite tricarboxylate transporter TctB family protein n=1 Tax=Planomicrobium sp. CPCC 101079 TaxID=2599618 RepID=UPI0021059511|nr:tripartite tricarboxylate transporter TctB family protein [Planomicrobium sp. CPCC 101079]
MIFFILIGVWFLINSLLLPESEGTADVGPSVFPIISAVGLIIASSFYLINDLRNRRNADKEKIVIPNRNKVISAIGILIAYLLVMDLVGYYIASIIAIPLLLYISGVKNVMKVGILSAGFLVFIYVGFDTLLGIPMP